MDLSKQFDRLPKRIRNSENALHYAIKFSKLIRKQNKNDIETNPAINFLFKSTNIKASGPLRDIQLALLELLRFVDNVCKKYELEYCIFYGTLLGSVRHDGFIPWDEDCDILMMRKDFNTLLEVLPQEIEKHEFFKENCALTKLISSEENLFYDFKNMYDFCYDENFNHFFGNKQLFLQITWLKPFIKFDIFPHDFVKEDCVSQYNEYYLSSKFYFRKLYDEENFLYEKEFNERFNRLGLTLDKTEFIGEGIDCSVFDDFGAFPTDYIFPLKPFKFENYEFSGPNNPDELLKLWYGETYMDIPIDFYTHYRDTYNTNLFDSKEDMDSAFKKTISYLKDINDNFE